MDETQSPADSSRALSPTDSTSLGSPFSNRIILFARYFLLLLLLIDFVQVAYK